MPSLLNRFKAAFSRPAPSAAPQPPSAVGYRVFTRAFDVEIGATELHTVLGALPPTLQQAHEEAWTALAGAMQGWRTRANLQALEASSRIRGRLGAEQLADTTVAILVDQSGSMRGQAILLTAAACDAAQDFVSHLGAAVEILGFTTVRWKGGRARERWVSRGMPAAPGRLCDLLHIVYRDATDRRASGAGYGLKPMLRPDLLKENVDGEALLWALARLRAQPARRKVLVVLSDGAPVDDSTLLANDPGYLDRHLKAVIADAVEVGDVRLVGVGIGFDPSRYYARSSLVETPDDLGEALLSALEAAICDEEPPVLAADHRMADRL